METALAEVIVVLGFNELAVALIFKMFKSQT